MKAVTRGWCHLLFLVAALLALAGLVSAQAVSPQADPNKQFDLDNVHGRYISAENAFDVSSVHAVTAQADLVGPPIFFATAEVMIADGRGKVCGEADGFYSGIDAPGVNLGPAYFYGIYSVDRNGRITITTYSTTAFCVPPATPPPCALCTASVQVGYLQDQDGGKIVTVDQLVPANSDTTGFLVHRHVWTRGKLE